MRTISVACKLGEFFRSLAALFLLVGSVLVTSWSSASPLSQAPPSSQAALASQIDGTSVLANLTGCFSVVYKFTENGKYQSEIKDVFEEIKSVPQTDGSLFFQHYGIQLGEKMLHWSESWSLDADGLWQQTVRGPDGGFRYTCVSSIEINQYRCKVANAPKPNRDRNRTDYETLDREITLQITDKSWIQSEVNTKRDKNNIAIANEVGWIEYRKADPKNCEEI